MLDAVLRCLPDGELLGIISQSPQADQDTPPLAALIREYSNSPVPQLLVPVTIHSGLHRSARGVRTTAFLRPGDLDAMHLILAATAHPRSEARMAANLDALLTYADQSYEGDDTWLVCTSPGLMHLCGQGHGGTSRPLDLPILPGRTGIHQVPGWVYVLGNSSMPGMVKIGRTRGNPEDRARALSAATGVPTPFKVLNALACRDEVAVEKAVHHHLARWRVSGRREFFAISPSQAAKALHSFSDRPGMSGNILLILCLSLLVAVIAVAVVVGWPGSPGEQSRAVTSAAVACAAFWLFSRKRRPTSRLPVSRRRR